MDSDMASKVVGLLFLAILLLTTLREIPKIGVLFKKSILLSFIPNWSFFAPIPGMFDYHLFVRHIAKDVVGPWEDLNLSKSKRPKLAWVWHPQKKYAKGLMDICQDLVLTANKLKNPDQIAMSLPYLQLLNYASMGARSMGRNRAVDAVQFMILGDSRAIRLELLFLSNTHIL